jgi:hypothetical protein
MICQNNAAASLSFACNNGSGLSILLLWDAWPVRRWFVINVFKNKT